MNHHEKEFRKNILEKLKKYIVKKKMPILAEFAYKNDLWLDLLYEYSKSGFYDEEFSQCIKKCVTKKQAYIERTALEGNLATTMAIFSLKQMGWKDRPSENDRDEDSISKLERMAHKVINENRPKLKAKRKAKEIL